jgi:hypothetical protein
MAATSKAVSAPASSKTDDSALAVVEKTFQAATDAAEAASVWPPPLFVFPEAGDSERHYMRNRWQAQWLYYDKKAAENKRRYQLLQITIGVGSVAVPVMLGFGGPLATAATVISLLVAAAAAIENVKQYGANWRTYRQAAEELMREKSLYDSHAGPYARSKRPGIRFVERCEEIIAAQNGQFLQHQEEAAEKSEKDAEDDSRAG